MQILNQPIARQQLNAYPVIFLISQSSNKLSSTNSCIGVLNMSMSSLYSSGLHSPQSDVYCDWLCICLSKSGVSLFQETFPKPTVSSQHFSIFNKTLNTIIIIIINTKLYAFRRQRRMSSVEISC